MKLTVSNCIFVGLILFLFSGQSICAAFALDRSVVSNIVRIDKIIHEILQRFKDERLRYDIRKPIDCLEVKRSGFTKSGIYEVQPLNSTTHPVSFNVYCDMDTDGGGWTVFQRRGNFGHPADYFLRNWANYSQGFGELHKDFWLGNEKLYSLTNQGSYSLRIDMKDKEGNKRYAEYREFRIGNKNDSYTLYVSGYSGNANDSLAIIHNRAKFSTFDRDNDQSEKSNCAKYYEGAWWFTKCHSSNLNGVYLDGPHKSRGKGIEWYDWKGSYYSLSETEMKIRRNL